MHNYYTYCQKCGTLILLEYYIYCVNSFIRLVPANHSSKGWDKVRKYQTKPTMGEVQEEQRNQLVKPTVGGDWLLKELMFAMLKG